MNYNHIVSIVISILSLLSFLITIIINIKSFFVPWVRSNVIIDQGYYKLNIPIDIGLLKCFSEICHKYEKYIASSYDETSNNLFPIHLPKKPPDIESIIKREVRNIEKPFILASKISIPFLVLAMTLCLINIIISIYCLFQYKTSYNNHLFSLLLSSILCNIVGVLVYISITIPHINGGEYLSGVWLITFSTIVSMAIALLIALLIDNTNKRNGYIQISNEQNNRNNNIIGIHPTEVAYEMTYQSSMPIVQSVI